jgi:diadenosine tetraphosphate (Ap4A) HIT family hydrolase
VIEGFESGTLSKNITYYNYPMDCLSCESISGKKRISPGKIIYQGKYWVVDHAYPSQLLGWLVIVLKRHAEALHELTCEEFAELAQILEKTVKTLHEEFKTEKEYISCFAEGENFKHIHVHVMPRMAELADELKGPRIFSLLKEDDTKAVPKQLIVELSERLNKKFI